MPTLCLERHIYAYPLPHIYQISIYVDFTVRMTRTYTDLCELFKDDYALGEARMGRQQAMSRATGPATSRACEGVRTRLNKEHMPCVCVCVNV